MSTSVEPIVGAFVGPRADRDEWADIGLILKSGELGQESDTGVVRVGDGVHLFADLQAVGSAQSGASALVKPDFTLGYPGFGFGVTDGTATLAHGQNALLVPSEYGFTQTVGGGDGTDQPIDDTWMTWAGPGATEFTVKREGMYALYFIFDLAAPPANPLHFDIRQPGNRQPSLWAEGIPAGALGGMHLDGPTKNALVMLTAGSPVRFRVDTSALGSDPTIAYLVVALVPLFT